jgi:hypothetical protein
MNRFFDLINSMIEASSSSTSFVDELWIGYRSPKSVVPILVRCHCQFKFFIIMRYTAGLKKIGESRIISRLLPVLTVNSNP